MPAAVTHAGNPAYGLAGVKQVRFGQAAPCLVYGRVLINRPATSALGQTGHIADIVKQSGQRLDQNAALQQPRPSDA
jgi:hypothetical protein